MPLRTYALIVHPAFLRHVEAELDRAHTFDPQSPTEIPRHRPKLWKATDIAKYLDVSPEIIRSVIRFKERHYRQFEFRKKSGGMRQIAAPRTFLKVVQWWILDTILLNTYVHPFVFGFVRGRSFVDNARAHLGSTNVLNVDIKDFFPSFRQSDVVRLFERLGYSEKVSNSLSEITTFNGSLPQGAPTSPMIANLIFDEIDIELRQLAEGAGILYTRYADDMTFSSSSRIELDFLGSVRRILSERGFILNEQKTRFMGRNQSREVTGLVLGSTGVALRREYLNSIRGWFHSALFRPQSYVSSRGRIAGTLQLLKQIGGRGTPTVIALGEKAVLSLKRTDTASSVVDLFPRQ